MSMVITSNRTEIFRCDASGLTAPGPNLPRGWRTERVDAGGTVAIRHYGPGY